MHLWAMAIKDKEDMLTGSRLSSELARFLQTLQPVGLSLLSDSQLEVHITVP